MTGCATRSATLEHIISDERFSVFIGQSSYCPVPLTAERFGLWSIAYFIGGSVLDHPVVFVPWSLSCQRKGQAVEDRVQPNLSPLSWSLFSYAAKPHFQLQIIVPLFSTENCFAYREISTNILWLYNLYNYCLHVKKNSNHLLYAAKYFCLDGIDWIVLYLVFIENKNVCTIRPNSS